MDIFIPALERRQQGFGAFKELVQVEEIGFGIILPTSSPALFITSVNPPHRVQVHL